MPLITLRSPSISGSISGWPWIRESPQLGTGGAEEILESDPGGWLNT